MKNYKKLYFELFNKVTDAIELLQEAQQQMESLYIESSNFDIVSTDTTDNVKDIHHN